MLLERGLERIGEAGVVGEELESVGRSQLEGKLEGVSWKSVGVSWKSVGVRRSQLEGKLEGVCSWNWNWIGWACRDRLLLERGACMLELDGWACKAGSLLVGHARQGPG